MLQIKFHAEVDDDNAMPQCRRESTDYLKFWSLTAPLFDHRDPDRFFGGQPQRHVLAEIATFFRRNEQICLISGDSGCGMTFLLEHLQRYSGFGNRAVQMTSLGDRVFDRCGSDDRSTGEIGIVLLLDQHRQITCEIHEWMRCNSDVSIILGCINQQVPSAVAMLEQVPRVIRFAPMTLEDSFAYVAATTSAVGINRLIFTKHAIVRMHEQSVGRLRDFARLAEQSLQLAAAWRLNKIDTSVIDSLEPNQAAAA